MQTEGIKGRIVEIMAATFDAASGESIEMPQVASGDFVVTKPRRGEPRLKLIACRRFVRRMTPAKLIHNILDTEWGKLFRSY